MFESYHLAQLQDVAELANATAEKMHLVYGPLVIAVALNICTVRGGFQLSHGPPVKS